MLPTLKTFSQKILYGFGFGGGMGVAYINRDIFTVKVNNILPKGNIKVDK